MINIQKILVCIVALHQIQYCYQTRIVCFWTKINLQATALPVGFGPMGGKNYFQVVNC